MYYIHTTHAYAHMYMFADPHTSCNSAVSSGCARASIFHDYISFERLKY